MPILAPPAKIPVRERVSILNVYYGKVDVRDGAFVVTDSRGVRQHIPIGGVNCLMLEPGTTITHAAVKLAAEVRCLLLWVGEAGVRLYSAGRPGGARADRLLYQAKLALDETARLRVVRKMYAMRFGEQPPSRRSVDQLRGLEGARVRKVYQLMADRYGVSWRGRRYDPNEFDRSDVANQCLSVATASLYGVTEAAVLAAGYSPAIGFIHTGKPLSFVYDIADLFKFETVVPIAFRVAAKRPAMATQQATRKVRLGCRDEFRKTKLLSRLVPAIDEVLAAGDMTPPPLREGQVPPAIPLQDEPA